MNRKFYSILKLNWIVDDCWKLHATLRQGLLPVLTCKSQDLLQHVTNMLPTCDATGSTSLHTWWVIGDHPIPIDSCPDSLTINFNRSYFKLNWIQFRLVAAVRNINWLLDTKLKKERRKKKTSIEEAATREEEYEWKEEEDGDDKRRKCLERTGASDFGFRTVICIQNFGRNSNDLFIHRKSTWSTSTLSTFRPSDVIECIVKE